MTIGTNGDFKTHLESRGLSPPHTIRAFTSDVRGFETFLAGEQPTEDRAEAFLANEKRRGLSNKTCARKRTSLLAYAHFWASLGTFPRSGRSRSSLKRSPRWRRRPFWRPLGTPKTAKGTGL